MLLSFAQFEREVIGERVRDKIAASKKKGIWVGGSVPQGYASVNKKVVIMPDDADKVRTIFRRYLEIGSITALAQDLERRGIRTRRQVLSNGQIRGNIPFGVGPLVHLLRNRFLIGDVLYHGEVYRGEHEPILARALFDAVQAKLAAQTVARRNRLKGSPAILMGRIFDDRRNRMSPSHSNKQGVRYRYYVSHPVVQGHKARGGALARVPGPELEAAVVAAIRQQFQQGVVDSELIPNGDRDLIERYVDHIIVKPNAIEIRWLSNARHDGHSVRDQGVEPVEKLLMTIVPWTASTLGAIKGVLVAPRERTVMKSETRDALLHAIAKARAWIDDLVDGRAEFFAEIARREKKVERHVRLLAPLAFVSPPLVCAIIEGSAGPDLTTTSLASSLPFQWDRK